MRNGYSVQTHVFFSLLLEEEVETEEQSVSTEKEAETPSIAEDNLFVYIEHVNGDITRWDTGVNLIQSRDELDNYLGESAEGGLRRISEKYVAGWFDSHVLVAVFAGHNGCDRGEVCQVSVEEKQLVLHIDIIHHTWDEFSDAEEDVLIY